MPDMRKKISMQLSHSWYFIHGTYGEVVTIINNISQISLLVLTVVEAML